MNNGYRRGSGFNPRRAGQRDPRQLLDNNLAYDPSYQADQAQFAVQSQAHVGNTIPLSQAVDQASNTLSNLSRVLVNYTAFYISNVQFGPGAANGQLLIPRNSNRSSFVLVNTGGPSVLWNYGTNASIAAGYGTTNSQTPGGIRLPGAIQTGYDPSNNPNITYNGGVSNAYFENAGPVSINDIYIYWDPYAFINKAGSLSDNYAVNVIGYEGVPILTSNSGTNT